MGWVYGIQSGAFIKVGATQDVKSRMHEFRLYNPHPIKLVMRRNVAEHYWIEKRMHEILDPAAIGREWFACTIVEVQDAYRLAYADLVAMRHTQTEWESDCVRRAAERAWARADRLRKSVMGPGQRGIGDIERIP